MKKTERELEEPLRSELFGGERMRDHGQTLARAHRVCKSRSRNGLLSRLEENESALRKARDVLAEAVKKNSRIFPAGDWLLDNFYLLEEHIYITKRDLPNDYSRCLPRLAEGLSAGLPRVYDIALERISHGDGLIDPDSLGGFLDAYQSVTVLTNGELWAIPIMFRLALIENIRRVAVRISAGMMAQNEADSWAEKMTASAETAPNNLILLIADMIRSGPPMVGSFVAELARKLKGKGTALALPLTWLEQRLSQTGLSIDTLVQTSLQQQAADQVTISNSFVALRSLGVTSWKDILEGTSVLDTILREDPARSYGKMDFQTRDRYRHAVEEIARRGHASEVDVAKAAMGLAKDGATRSGKNDRSAHVGYYLIDRGFKRLTRAAHVRNFKSKISRVHGSPGVFALYCISMLTLTALATAVLMAAAYNMGARDVVVGLLILPALIVSAGFSSVLINWVVSVNASPHMLPRMDFSEGMPSACSSLVVVPAMLASDTAIDYLIETLEVRYLANRDDNLSFGVLTDYADGKGQTAESDEPLLLRMSQEITALNAKYKSPRGAPFYLFHRPRRWNAQERMWMGYERKRGKLAALNSLLRGGGEGAFQSIVGSVKRLQSVKYVITLDTDTQLPRDCARQLAGVMAHPLNRPRYDAQKGRVVEGYGILQPRVSSSLPDSRQSYYTLLNDSEGGLDQYTRAVSDVYQDLFGEGSFIGKGIYDVDAFEKALKGRFPENRILSHDLIEGCYARCALVSDVLLYEKPPALYPQDAMRALRWMRGDWQIARWIFPAVPSLDGRTRKNGLSALSRWKIADNLRRSLQAPSLLALLFLGWGFLSASPYWTGFVLAIMVIPQAMISVSGFFRKKPSMPLASHAINAVRSSFGRLAQALFAVMCLPYEAFSNISAIAKSAFRLHITHRRLLEWVPFSRYGKIDSNMCSSVRTMWPAPAIALAAGLFIHIFHPSAFPLSALLLAVWFVSPVVVWAVGRPLRSPKTETGSGNAEFLGRAARKTWSFFETFVTEADNHLPPDNFQEIPKPTVAHRTSPTNMGLALLSNLSAYDLGYLPMGKLIERTGLALESMNRLERYRNHFYNWYDTQTLRPLPPLYVSTVDSGNLSAHLMTLHGGFSLLPEDPVLGKRVWEGLRDTESILRPLLDKDTGFTLARFGMDLDGAIATAPFSLREARRLLDRLAVSARAARDSVGLGVETQAAYWAGALVSQIEGVSGELAYLVPWLTDDIPLSGSFEALANGAIPSLAGLRSCAYPEESASPGGFNDLARKGLAHVGERFALIDRLALHALDMSRADFTFLYSKKRHLLSIGFNTDNNRRDGGYYDLLASEARLTSFIAIAQDQIPQESWFALGRKLAHAGGKTLLLSWSGSIFEYLMPNLVLPVYEKSLLDESCASAVKRQIEYGAERNIPWGISESGYNSFDSSRNYQYKAFGVPGLGLKNGPISELVIAPYATALSLLVMPEEACKNLRVLSDLGFEGRYGFYEAIDYTKSRVPAGQTRAIVYSFMAHHQGMSLLSFASCLTGKPMQKRFVSNPYVKGATLLLEEKIPHAVRRLAYEAETTEYVSEAQAGQSFARVFTSPHTATPEVHLLSNGRYHVMVTNAGGGYSRLHEMAVTRWTDDVTLDNRGSFVYLRDVQSGEVWSNTYQPTCRKSELYEAVFSEGRAEFSRLDHDIETKTEIAVSPEEDVEVRRVRLTNRSHKRRIIELTTYAEVVLAPSSSDASHPGFGNLFVQTEILREQQSILCTRRPRSDGEHVYWMAHLLTAQNANVVEVSYETDRLAFIGRLNSLSNPAAMNKGGALSGGSGSVLDPIIAIRVRIIIEADCTAVIDCITGITDARSSAVDLAKKYRDACFTNRVFELARTHSQVILQQIDGTEKDVKLYSRIAGSILFPHSRLRAPASIISANRRGQSGLWGYSVSGDIPIVLLQIRDPANIELVRQLVQAHGYWRQKGLVVDLIIWNEDQAGYRQQLQDLILGLITAGVNASLLDRTGGIFVRFMEQIADEDRILIQASARVIFADSRGSLDNQAGGTRIPKVSVPLLVPSRIMHKPNKALQPAPRQDLAFFNGMGGFSQDGREYVITLSKDLKTPAPWSNVIANPDFGTVVSESGMAYTWSENSHENRLTPWHDDPVRDVSGEALYVRDEESGRFWSPSALPCGGETPYVTRHGFGYSVFEHSERGISTELWVFVATDAPVKIALLKIRNESGRARKLSATSYVELVLGEHRSSNAMHVVTEVDRGTGAVFAHNRYSRDFPDQVVFLGASGEGKTVSGDRTEFLGRNGSMRKPEAMERLRLSGITGAALDPCAAVQVQFDLADGNGTEVIFAFGSAHGAEEAGALVRRFTSSPNAYGSLEQVWRYWKRTHDSIQVETPDPSLNVLANGWLMYQVLSSRMWGRSGYYQSGGAFGFRDQLQDAMAIVHAESALLRAQILLCAAHQFVEGDVQHWWHPPSGRGSRTRCSDDYLWLPLAVCRYVSCTGDRDVLNVMVAFLQGKPIMDGEESSYDLPVQTDQCESLYDHCVLAILHAKGRGTHSLPLMGSGDWNDGMNKVGEKGIGESVWLAFFLYDVLIRFGALSAEYGDAAFSERCNSDAGELKGRIDAEGWDGQWYRRAYFDDGTPLGSSENAECRIDSISQSWSVLSGAGSVDRSRIAMDSLDERLVRRGDKLVRLLDPPFDTSLPNPGYIRGYVPGVRENGGQYTHAAVWAIMAFAELGDSKRAWELFDIINPVNHSSSSDKAEIYMVEPYVMAADVYSCEPHVGRGGWTWYTGSAGLMYRLIIESLLGVSVEADVLRIAPCLPIVWEGFRFRYQYRETMYHVSVKRALPGTPGSDASIRLVDDRKEHRIEIYV